MGANHDLSLHEMRHRLIENSLYVGRDVEADVKERAKGPSLRRALVENVTLAALEYAHATAAGADEYRDLARGGLGLIDDLQHGLTEFSWNDPDPTRKWNFWNHEHRPRHLIVAGQTPRISRETIEEVGSGYLRLPYRAEHLERLIVDVLIATELYAFGEEMLRKPTPEERRFGKPSPFHERHVLLAYLTSTFWSAVVLLGLAYLAAMFLPSTFGMWATGILVGLFFLVLAIDTVLLPWRWRHQRKRCRNVVNLIRLMNDTYRELSPAGLVSTRRLRELAVKAADAGVVWPSPLIAMLDDNIERVGRL
jgi:hypothetical protein